MSLKCPVWYSKAGISIMNNNLFLSLGMRLAYRGFLLFTLPLLLCLHFAGNSVVGDSLCQSPVSVSSWSYPIEKSCAISVSTRTSNTYLLLDYQASFTSKLKKKKGFRRLMQHSPCMYTREANLVASPITPVTFSFSYILPLDVGLSQYLIRGPPAFS
jgi:hypothetical protein